MRDSVRQPKPLQLPTATADSSRYDSATSTRLSNRDTKSVLAGNLIIRTRFSRNIAIGRLRHVMWRLLSSFTYQKKSHVAVLAFFSSLHVSLQRAVKEWQLLPNKSNGFTMNSG